MAGFNKAFAHGFPLTTLLITPLDTWWQPDITKWQGSMELKKTEPKKLCGVKLFLELPPNLSDFSSRFGSLNVKIRNYMKIITCVPCNHANNKSGSCKYHTTTLKNKEFFFGKISNLHSGRR